jgi:hypothetical protein
MDYQHVDKEALNAGKLSGPAWMVKIIKYIWRAFTTRCHIEKPSRTMISPNKHACNLTSLASMNVNMNSHGPPAAYSETPSEPTFSNHSVY